MINLPTIGVAERWGLGEEAAENYPSVIGTRRPVYCDDAVLPFMGDAANLVVKVSRAATVAQAVYGRFGMQINCKRGKTD